MPKHSMKICWLHLVWGTKERNPYFLDVEKAVIVLDYLKKICLDNSIYYKVGYVNPEHVHLLVDLPVDLSISDLMQLLKGSSSHCINESRMLKQHFLWARGYGAFSVDYHKIDEVINYIINQKAHHKETPFEVEWERYKQRYDFIISTRN